jgi:hypothetical protein
MAQSYNGPDHGTLIVPGTYVAQKVIAGQGGLALSGVVTLVGEADQGKHWSQEEDVSATGFRPDQLNAVINRYGSGPLVDGFRAVIAANADPAIAGSATLIYLVKTNQGTKASALADRSGFGTWAQLQAKLAGKPGNSISFKTTTEKAEVAPQLALGYFPRLTGTSTLKIRINGSAQTNSTVLAQDLPPTIAPSIEDDKILCQGGEDRAILAIAGTLALAVAGSNITITRSVAWEAQPQAGDTLWIPATSVIAGGSAQNVGSYRVTASTPTTVTAKKIFAGSLIAVSATAIAALDDVQAFSPLTIKNMTGMDRDILDAVTGNITPTLLAAKSVKLTLDAGKLFAATPQVGEIVHVPALFGTVVEAGWYEITAVSNVNAPGSITLSRLSNGDLSGTPTAEPIVSSLLRALKADIDGLAKSMEVEMDTNARNCFLTAAGVASPAAQLLVSAQERQAKITLIKPATPMNQSEAYVIGGNIVLSIGYNGATCSMTLDNSSLVTTASNPADSLNLSMDDFGTVQTLVDYLNTQPNYTAKVEDLRYAAISPKDLCEVACDVASQNAYRPARIKRDAQDAINKLADSIMVELAAIPAAGLPEAMLQEKFLSAGAKGASKGSDVVEAIDALEKIQTNFVVSLFDRDAADDVAQSLTEDPSDIADRYEIDAINAKMKSHVVAMSAVKARKNRIAIVSKQADYTACKDASKAIMHPRVTMCFSRAKDVSAAGTIKTFAVWYTACKTAGMAAAAGYKGIVKKFVNVSGMVYPSDFDPRLNGDLEDALLSGLTVIEPVTSGGFRYVSDQTTYTVDNNFVYNSIQAIYVADLITLTLIQNSDRVIVGQSVADMSAVIIKGFVQSEMANFLRLKLIAPSDDAPSGYKNLSVQLKGGVAEIAVEVKLAGIIYFVPITLSISEVQQSA